MASKKRLIDAIALISKARRMETTDNNGIPVDTFAVPVMAIEDAFTVDTVEVVHGHWCWEGKFKACSRCGSYVEWDETLGANFWKFCPFCGAKMDGGADNGL